MRCWKSERSIESEIIKTQTMVKKCSQNAAECLVCVLFDGNKSNWDLRCMNYFNAHQRMNHCDDVVKKDE